VKLPDPRDEKAWWKLKRVADNAEWISFNEKKPRETYEIDHRMNSICVYSKQIGSVVQTLLPPDLTLREILQKLDISYGHLVSVDLSTEPKPPRTDIDPYSDEEIRFSSGEVWDTDDKLVPAGHYSFKKSFTKFHRSGWQSCIDRNIAAKPLYSGVWPTEYVLHLKQMPHKPEEPVLFKPYSHPVVVFMGDQHLKPLHFLIRLRYLETKHKGMQQLHTIRLSDSLRNSITTKTCYLCKSPAHSHGMFLCADHRDEFCEQLFSEVLRNDRTWLTKKTEETQDDNPRGEIHSPTAKFTYADISAKNTASTHASETIQNLMMCLFKKFQKAKFRLVYDGSTKRYVTVPKK